jgi:predicted TPR repeat methyltransferase
MLVREIELDDGTSVEVMQNTSSGELGATVWDCALTLIHSWSQAGKDWKVRGKVLDLSCGTGVCGMVAEKLFKDVEYVTLADMEQLTPLIEENIQRNNLKKAKAAAFMWGDNATKLEGPYDFILATDLVTKSYAKYYPQLLQSMWELSHDDTEIFLSVELRSQEDKLFFEMLPKFGFSCENLESWIHPHFRCEEIRLFKLKKTYDKNDSLYK